MFATRLASKRGWHAPRCFKGIGSACWRRSPLSEKWWGAAAMLAVSSRFRDGVRQADHYIMVGGCREFILINRTGPYIAIVIGPHRDQATSTSSRRAEKLKRKGDLHESP